MTNTASLVRRTLGVVALSIAALASLASSTTPSINNAAKADVDRRIGALTPSARTVPAPTSAEPMPLAPGQWVTVKQTDQDNRPSIVTYKIVGMQDGAYWYEMSMDTYYGHSAMRMLVAIGNRQDPASVDVRSVTTKDYEGRVQEMPPSVLGMMRSTYASMIDQLVIRWESLPQEDLRVVGGSFAACYRGRSTVSFAGVSATSDAWFHPAVPINGVVQQKGIDRPMTMELIDYGVEGATSEF